MANPLLYEQSIRATAGFSIMGCFEKRKDHEAVTGVRLEIMTAPETITPEALAEGLRQQPPI